MRRARAQWAAALGGVSRWKAPRPGSATFAVSENLTLLAVTLRSRRSSDLSLLTKTPLVGVISNPRGVTNLVLGVIWILLETVDSSGNSLTLDIIHADAGLIWDLVEPFDKFFLKCVEGMHMIG